jgi:mono/diheme cytochrome c family protein
MSHATSSKIIAVAATLFALSIASNTLAVDYARDVKPILEDHCYSCHGPTKQEGGLRLDIKTQAMLGGDSGKVIQPKKAKESLLIQLVTGVNPEEVMPPEGKRLTAKQIDLLRQWIEEGAVWPEVNSGTPNAKPVSNHWSLQPLNVPEVPQGIEGTAWGKHEVDWLILQRLLKAGLKPSAQAGRRTLIRRLSYDLIGLPPTPKEIEAFVNDKDPQAYEKLVDRLLASPHYGERWARHWLDVVRFGESNGFEHNQPRNNAWPYRNWVIHALNDDMPYDKFIRMQLAGDQLAKDDLSMVAATGFLVAGPYNPTRPASQKMRMTMQQDEYEDLVGTIGQAFIGLTINCARCHSHKFDPITQREYYSFVANIAGVTPGDRDTTLPGAGGDVKQKIERLNVKRKPLVNAIRNMENTARASVLAKRKKGDLPQPVLPKPVARWEFDGNLNDTIGAANDVAASAGAATDFVGEKELVEALTPAQREKRGELKAKLQAVESALKTLERSFKPIKVYAVRPRKPGESHVLLRGDVSNRGDVVTPGGLAAVPGASADFGLTPAAGDADRRVKLAQWITDRNNPLFSRVIVNRLWQYHFGTGIVDTPSDFGINGGKPSHPQLLDWLANQLITNDWSLKHIHRLMVTSAAYQQASKLNRAAMKVDAGNRLHWRREPRRLEGEAIRDTILSVTGQLDRTVGGIGYRDVREYRHKGSHFYALADAVSPEANRRTIYRFAPRGARITMLDTFDCPDPSAMAPKRAVTTTPLQALALMNNPFVLMMADHFATRLKREAGTDVNQQVQQLYELVYGRPADAAELPEATTFIKSHGLAAFCRVVFNSNEFLYVQ